MDSLVILLLGTVGLLAFGVFVSGSLREKSGKNIHDKNNPWNFWLPVIVILVVYMVVMAFRQ
jgi:uncharacterized BrkB/YihY/UPF0761 family membrane protein